jgi:drug/metabolite transporter (DMT)-like permease
VADWLSYLAFYRALAIGPISLLSPIASGYSAVTVVLAVLIAGERLSAVEAGAVLVTIAGVIVVSADVSRIGRPEDRSPRFARDRTRDRSDGAIRRFCVRHLV